jgi:hypothetical protein
LRVLDEVTGDLRYAFRQLKRSPAFATIAVLSLALSIGANTAIFSLMEAAFWKAIPGGGAGHVHDIGTEGGTREC